MSKVVSQLKQFEVVFDRPYISGIKHYLYFLLSVCLRMCLCMYVCMDSWVCVFIAIVAVIGLLLCCSILCLADSLFKVSTLQFADTAVSGFYRTILYVESPSEHRNADAL